MADVPRDTSSERSPKEHWLSSEAVNVAGRLNQDRVVTAAEKRAVRKLDYSIIPVMAMFYLLSFLVITS